MERSTIIRLLLIGLMVILMTLVIIGLVMIYSTTSDYYGIKIFRSQCVWVSFGVLASLVIALLPLEWLTRYSSLMLCGIGIPLAYLACACMVYKFLPREILGMFPLISGEIKGSFQWLNIFGYGFQPSEFSKFALLLFLSSYYGLLKRSEIERFTKGFLIPSLTSGLILSLILLGQDLGTMCVTAVMVGTIMFCAGVKLRHLGILVVLGLCLVGVMLAVSPERLSRITSFRQAEAMSQGEGYQVTASLLALGGGGAMGRGYTNGVIKMGYLPERHTDFILSVWGEEMGFVGMVFVLCCYFGLMVCLVWLVCLCRERTGMLLCIGFCMLVMFQAIVNIGVISAWGPTTGITAPFISYGGSSMLSLMMCVGLVFNVGLRTSRALKARAVKGSELPNYSDLKSTLRDSSRTVN